LEPKALLRHAYIEAKSMASELASPDTDITQAKFTALLRIVYIIVHFHFGSNLVDVGHETTADNLPMSKIRRRLYKISQYYTGAVRIHHCRQFVPEGTEIPHVWIRGPEPIPLTLSKSPVTTAERHFPTLSEKKLERAKPNIFDQWNSTVLLRVHP
jgi:hypothetical protein